MWLVLCGALLCLAGSAWQTLRVVRIEHWNGLIVSGKIRDTSGAPPAARFAAAYAAAGRGEISEALNEYRELQRDAGPRLRHDAMFNSGNLYAQQAVDALKASDPSAALTLAELAKASYRELLREDADDWDARYNLEKILRMAPDPDEEQETLYTPPTHLQGTPIGSGTNLGLP